MAQTQPLASAASVGEIWRKERAFRITLCTLCLLLAGAVVSYFIDPPKPAPEPTPHGAVR